MKITTLATKLLNGCQITEKSMEVLFINRRLTEDLHQYRLLGLRYQRLSIIGDSALSHFMSLSRDQYCNPGNYYYSMLC